MLNFQTQKSWLGVSLVVALALALAACGDDAVSPPATSRLPYASGETVVLGGGTGGSVLTTPAGAACLQVSTSTCVSPQDTCGSDTRVDVVVDDSGEVVRVVCYPTNEAELPIDFIDSNFKPDEAGALIIVDGLDDGVDIVGNVELQGDDMVLYGEGPLVSVLGANLKITGVRTSVTGVRIMGNVDLEAEDVYLSRCVIEGNLHIKADGIVVVECTILGNVKVDQNARIALITNRAANGWEINESAEMLCTGNLAFEDLNENLTYDEGEAGDALTCE